jgi:hypothetical protein
MAVKVLRKNLDRFDFAGLSSDSKPTTCNYGSTFYVTDLGDLYIYTGAGWVLKYELIKLAAFTAGETHLGEVSLNRAIVQVIPAIAAAAFSANDFVGGKLTIPSVPRISGGAVLLKSLCLIDTAKQAAPLKIFFFKSLPGGTYADNAAESISVADWLLYIGEIDIVAADYATMANASVVAFMGIELPLIGTTTNLFALMVTTGTPTYTLNCLQLTLGLERS